MKPGLIIAVSLFTASLSVQAATPSLESCAAIEDSVERLACYDILSSRSPVDTTKASGAASGVVDPVAPKADIVVQAAPAAKPTVPAVEPKPDTDAIFGLEHKSEKDQPDELKFKWVRKKKDAYGKLIIFMENGQVWRQTDTKRFIFGNSENRVIVSRGFAGGFFLKEPESHVRIRVKRVK